jgi:hypothetical protein
VSTVSTDRPEAEPRSFSLGAPLTAALVLSFAAFPLFAHFLYGAPLLQGVIGIGSSFLVLAVILVSARASESRTARRAKRRS